MASPLGRLSAAEFLRDYWQKRPLLIRGAYPGFTTPLDGDELAGLACDPDVESRIVTGDFAVRNGPFTADDFAVCGDRDWTLLVQDVDKHAPELAGILDDFAFVPRWRVDDLMVSWAADGGSVGPHVDQYDVFLLQAEGRRRWRIGEPAPDAPHRPDLALRVLADFTATDEWVLEPGDMLYLPPGVPHWGVAVGSCMTWSIGFRAPSAAEVVSDFAERTVGSLTDAQRYADPDLAPDEADDGRISDAAFTRARALLEHALARGNAEFPRWFGELVTAPKAWLHADPPEHAVDPAALAARLRGGAVMLKDTRANLAWFRLDDGLCLCVDGNALDLPTRLEPLVRALCTARVFPAGALTRYLDDDDSVALLARLYNGGQLAEPEDE